MAATAQQFADFLEPLLSNIWHDSFPKYELKYSQVFNVRDMDKNTITDAELGGFGDLQAQADGASVIYDDPITPRRRAYTYSVRALGYQVHDRLWRNDLYGEVERFERDLMDAANDDAEQSAADIFINAFGTTNVGFDGLALCSTAHTRLDGGANQANNPSTDEALSLGAIHSALITIRGWVNHNGRPRKHTPRRLILPPELMVTGYELMDSVLHPETANNTKNVIVSRFGLEEPLVWEYLTSSTAWWMLCDQHDLNFYWRFRPETAMETDFDTQTIKRQVRQGYVTGFGQWLGVYGTDGVA